MPQYHTTIPYHHTIPPYHTTIPYHHPIPPYHTTIPSSSHHPIIIPPSHHHPTIPSSSHPSPHHHPTHLPIIIPPISPSSSHPSPHHHPTHLPIIIPPISPSSSHPSPHHHPTHLPIIIPPISPSSSHPSPHHHPTHLPIIIPPISPSSSHPSHHSLSSHHHPTISHHLTSLIRVALSALSPHPPPSAARISTLPAPCLPSVPSPTLPRPQRPTHTPIPSTRPNSPFCTAADRPWCISAADPLSLPCLGIGRTYTVPGILLPRTPFLLPHHSLLSHLWGHAQLKTPLHCRLCSLTLSLSPPLHLTSLNAPLRAVVGGERGLPWRYELVASHGACLLVTIPSLPLPFPTLLLQRLTLLPPLPQTPLLLSPLTPLILPFPPFLPLPLPQAFVPSLPTVSLQQQQVALQQHKAGRLGQRMNVRKGNTGRNVIGNERGESGEMKALQSFSALVPHLPTASLQQQQVALQQHEAGRRGVQKL
ncbi:unnamed protein product [Closterium sp. Naga37s-1]|nr:unnamed protein product [Closterium sp. Naga37s-1]